MGDGWVECVVCLVHCGQACLGWQALWPNYSCLWLHGSDLLMSTMKRAPFSFAFLFPDAELSPCAYIKFLEPGTCQRQLRVSYQVDRFQYCACSQATPQATWDLCMFTGHFARSHIDWALSVMLIVCTIDKHCRSCRDICYLYTEPLQHTTGETVTWPGCHRTTRHRGYCRTGWSDTANIIVSYSSLLLPVLILGVQLLLCLRHHKSISGQHSLPFACNIQLSIGENKMWI